MTDSLIKFFCQSCGNPIRVSEDHAGSAGHCKRCGKPITIPLVANSEPPPVPLKIPGIPHSKSPTCPVCGSRSNFIETKISTAGWVTFTLLLIFTIVLFWVGFFLKDEYRVCGQCGHVLGKVWPTDF